MRLMRYWCPWTLGASTRTCGFSIMKMNGPSKTRFIVVKGADESVGFLVKVEHPNVVTTGTESMAFNSSRRFIAILSIQGIAEVYMRAGPPTKEKSARLARRFFENM